MKRNLKGKSLVGERDLVNSTRFCIFEALCFYTSRILGTENRDSGVADIEVCPCQCPCAQNQVQSEGVMENMGHEVQIKRSALSNSLLDIHEQCKS